MKNKCITRLVSGSIIPLAIILTSMGDHTTVSAQDDAVVAVQQAENELERLERQDPERFLQLFDFMLEEGRFERNLVERTKNHTRDYIRARTTIIQQMYVSFINNDTGFDYTNAVAELVRLEQSFQDTMVEVNEKIPDLGTLPRMLNESSLRLPSFVEQKDEGDSLPGAQ